MINKTELLLGFTVKEKVELFKQLYAELSGYGQDGDTELAHVNPYEVALLKSVGGSGTVNSVTGLREYKGGGSSPPPPATQTVRQEATIPDELKPYVKDILAESQAQYQAEKDAGYTPYAGQQLATFTPEQQQAFQATRGIFEQGLSGTPLGQSTTYLAPALGATTAATLPTTAESIRGYMDPYLENVLRVQEQEARRADEISRQGRASQAVQAGAFGGSREAVMEAEAQRGLEDRLASLRATGMSQAFGTAQQMAEAQRARELAAGRQYAALGETAAQQQAREIGGLAATGEALRGQQQAALDIAKTQFMEEQQFPQTQLQQYSSIIRGFPLTPSQLQTTQTVTPQPSLTQQLLGAGVGAAGLAGAFGAFKGVKEGGLVGLAGGGRPMDAEPKRSRAELMGTAIGDLAGRMGAGRESVTSGGLRSMAPRMLAKPSFGMDDMPQEMPTATPMQMPSQRFMNEGGIVGYYQTGTGSGTIPYSQQIGGNSLPIQTSLRGYPSTAEITEETKKLQETNKARAAVGLRQLEFAKRLETQAVPTAEDTAFVEMLKKRQDVLGKREGEIATEETEAKDLLDRQKYLTLLNVGAAIASPQDGTQGFLPDVTKALASQTDKFTSLMDKEANIAKEKREKLDNLSDKQLDNMAKRRGISREALDRQIEAEKLTLSSEMALAEANAKAAQSEVEQKAAYRKEFRDALAANADLASAQAALIKAGKPETMKSTEFTAVLNEIAKAYGATIVTDASGNSIGMTINGRPVMGDLLNTINAAKKEAMARYISTGGGAEGYQAVMSSFGPGATSTASPPPPPGTVLMGN
jgi:hypothetical protein